MTSPFEAVEVELQRIIAARGLGNNGLFVANRAHAALSALRAALPALREVPAGWKLVPVEPTPEMVNAGGFADTEATDSYTGDFTHCIGDSAAREAYRAMLAAAPPGPAAPQLQGGSPT